MQCMDCVYYEKDTVNPRSGWGRCGKSIPAWAEASLSYRGELPERFRHVRGCGTESWAYTKCATFRGEYSGATSYGSTS
jgi:hypothetical protein